MLYFYFCIVLFVIPIITYLILYIIGKKSNDNLKETGFDVARKILDDNGLSSTYIVLVKGLLTDHYDYGQKVIRLSSLVYDGNSKFAHVIASYIAMIAILDKEKDNHIKIRGYLINMVNFFTIVSLLLFIIGILISYQLVEFSFLLLLIVYLYYIYSMYGTNLIISRVKSNKEIVDYLWIVYFFDISSMVLGVIGGVNDLIDSIKK